MLETKEVVHEQPHLKKGGEGERSSDFTVYRISLCFLSSQKTSCWKRQQEIHYLGLDRNLFYRQQSGGQGADQISDLLD